MNEVAIISKEDIKDKIYTVRGLKVMLDFDLAEIYGYTTKAFNQQVQRNIERFDDDFRFQLTKKELEDLSRSQIVTLNNNKGRGSNIKYMPYAFTEQGIYMLMTVLKGEKAIKESKNLIRIFKGMKDYLVENNILDQKYINNLVMKQESIILSHDLRISKIESKIEELDKIHRIFLKGDIYDAYSFILDIFCNTSNELIIIDNYVNKEILNIVSKLNINIKIISKNIDEDLIKKYKIQYNNVSFFNNDSFHDRFIIIDRKTVLNIGSSIKDIGKKVSCVTRITEKEEINKIIGYINKIENL